MKKTIKKDFSIRYIQCLRFLPAYTGTKNKTQDFWENLLRSFHRGGFYWTIDLCGFRSETKMTSKALKIFKLCWPAYNMGFAKCGLQNFKSAVGFQSNICKLALRFANLRPTELTEHRVPHIAKPRALTANFLMVELLHYKISINSCSKICIMKTLLLLLFAFSLNSPLYANLNDTNYFSENSVKPLKKFRVQGSVTASGGCVITYDLTIDVTIIPPKLNSVTGTLTFNEKCNGQQSITVLGKGTVNSSYVFTDFYFEGSPFEDLSLEAFLEGYFLELFNELSDEIFSEE